MADIFISYAREDLETAQRLAQALGACGWSVWWDRHIPTGRRFHEVIERELTAAGCVIPLWSKAAVTSSWVREEAQDGLDRGVIVPASIEAVPLPLGFRTVQTADLSGWQGNRDHAGFAQLVQDIEDLIGPAPNRLADERRQAAEDARQRAEEEERQRAAAEAKQKAEEEERQRAAAEAKRKAEEGRQRAAAEAKRLAEEEKRRLAAEAEVKRQVEDARTSDNHIETKSGKTSRTFAFTAPWLLIAGFTSYVASDLCRSSFDFFVTRSTEEKNKYESFVKYYTDGSGESGLVWIVNGLKQLFGYGSLWLLNDPFFWELVFYVTFIPALYVILLYSCTRLMCVKKAVMWGVLACLLPTWYGGFYISMIIGGLAYAIVFAAIMGKPKNPHSHVTVTPEREA